MNIKHAYEVYSLVGGGYNKRHLHGYAWTKKDAQVIADKVHPRRYYIGMVHLIKIGKNWHRIHVLPVQTVEGEISFAEESRIARNDIPEHYVPAINFQMDGGLIRRMSLDMERCIDMLASYGPETECKLFTLRIGGRLPLTFRIRDLTLSDHTQKQVVEWLRHEIDFRLNLLPKKECNEPDQSPVNPA